MRTAAVGFERLALRNATNAAVFLLVLALLRRVRRLRLRRRGSGTDREGGVGEAEEVVRTALAWAAGTGAYGVLKGRVGHLGAALASVVPLRILTNEPSMRLNYSFLSAYVASKAALQVVPYLDRCSELLLSLSVASLLHSWLAAPSDPPQEQACFLRDVTRLDGEQADRFRDLLRGEGKMVDYAPLCFPRRGSAAAGTHGFDPTNPVSVVKAAASFFVSHLTHNAVPFFVKVHVMKAVYFWAVHRERSAAVTLMFDVLRSSTFLSLYTTTAYAGLAALAHARPDESSRSPLVAGALAVPALALSVETPQQKRELAAWVAACALHPVLVRHGACDAAMLGSAVLFGSARLSTPNVPMRMMWGENPQTEAARGEAIKTARALSKASKDAFAKGGVEAARKAARSAAGGASSVVYKSTTTIVASGRL